MVAGLAGIAIGPSLGHIYAGDAWNTGLQLRLVSLATGAAGVVMIARSGELFGPSTNSAGSNAGASLLLVGLVGQAGTLYEIVDASGATRRANERRLQLVPTIASDAAGASLAGRF